MMANNVTTATTFLKALAAAALIAFVLTVLPMLSGFRFDYATAPYIIVGCLVAGLITGFRAHFSEEAWTWKQVFIECFSTVAWLALAGVCVLLYQGNQ